VVLHVGDLDGSATSTSGNRWRTTVTITALDASNNPVNGVKVRGNWSNGASDNVTCTTDTAGKCSVTVSRLTAASVRYNVKKLVKAGASYSAAANTDPDGDSNGTFIVVPRP
jgi:hypothetical protein